MQAWAIYVPGFVIVIGFIATFRWLSRLQNHADDVAERVAWLEAKVDGKGRT